MIKDASTAGQSPQKPAGQANTVPASNPKIVEPTIFDLSSPGRTGVKMPASDVPETELPPKHLLRSSLNLPELAEVDVVRHYMHLSKFNYSVDSGYYPLGSCTMKYNPKINEDTCRLPGFLFTHPLQPTETVQGNLALMYQLQEWLKEIEIGRASCRKSVDLGGRRIIKKTIR